MKNSIDAKLHLNRFNPKALPCQYLSHNMKPRAIKKGAKSAANTPLKDVSAVVMLNEDCYSIVKSCLRLANLSLIIETGYSKQDNSVAD